jgi:protein gp37
VSDKSAIEWCDATWNPTTGCTKISPGCAHCYIETTTPFRMQGRKFVHGHIPLKLHDGRLEQPLRWKKPKRIFVNSLSDLFHADVPDSFIDRVFAVMALTPQHTYQLLTKRPDRMLAYLGVDRFELVERIESQLWEMHTEDTTNAVGRWPLPNVWLGVSVENQDFLKRIDLLKDTPAAVRFVSFEPLLEDLGAVILDGIDWGIIGFESGAGARRGMVDWVLSLLRQCRAQGVTPFVKQLGHEPSSLAPVHWVSGRLTPHPNLCEILPKKGGDWSLWPEALRVREFPEARA